jgi:hypothetical protein
MPKIGLVTWIILKVFHIFTFGREYYSAHFSIGIQCSFVVGVPDIFMFCWWKELLLFVDSLTQQPQTPQ